MQNKNFAIGSLIDLKKSRKGGESVSFELESIIWIEKWEIF